GAEAAVVGAAFVGAGAKRARRSSGLAEFVAIVIRHVGTDHVLDEAVFRAAFAEVDAAGADDDLGVHEPATRGAEAASGPEEGVVAQVHGAALGRPLAPRAAGMTAQLRYAD